MYVIEFRTYMYVQLQYSPTYYRITLNWVVYEPEAWRNNRDYDRKNGRKYVVVSPFTCEFFFEMTV